MTIKNVSYQTFSDDDYTCECGNHTDKHGFVPCDKNGNECEPMLNIWKSHWKCVQCKLVIKVMM